MEEIFSNLSIIEIAIIQIIIILGLIILLDYSRGVLFNKRRPRRRIFKKNFY